MQFAIRAASWVVDKALSPIGDGFLEAWAASTGLGPNVEALKLQLLYAEAMLSNARARDMDNPAHREMDNPALTQLLHKLRDLAYGADDVLDELDYFRIQDELHGTHHAAADIDGCVQGLVLNAGHTCRAVASKLRLISPASPAEDDSDGDDEEEEDGYGGDMRKGCLSRVCSCGGGFMPPKKITSAACNTAHAIGNGIVRSLCGGSGTRRPSQARQKRRSEETPKLKLDRVAISKRIKDIVEQLKPVCGMVSTILSIELQGSNHAATKDHATKRPITTQDILIPELYGRNDQLNSITDGITHGEYSAKQLTVIPVVGPGGIGKTTLAQHVYQKVKSHFHVSIWICVSLNFNANMLAQEIVKRIPEVNGENKNASVQEIIEQRVKSKRFLLVLDDIWTCQEDEWRKLLAPFSKGEEKGNMVIVTTRFPEVAKMVRMSDCLMELGGLGAQDFMSFFEACAFGYQQPWKEHPELLDIGAKIVNKLKGSPLAAKTVGKLLRSQLTLQHWRRVLESKEWELQTSDNDIMPALKLSYDYLPFHLQQCFSYFALFPEDYRFYSSELIRFWMGLDILHPVNQNERIEDAGHRYFQDLVKFAFLKRNETDGERPYYVVHDLLHELATKVSSHECLSICSSNVRSRQIPTSVRHLSIIVENEDVNDRVTFEHYEKDLGALHERLKVKNLRTLMLFGQRHECFVKTFKNLFREATMLRSVLCGASPNIKDLLPNFSKLVHLRHLRTKDGYAGRIILPSTISRLYHLKILDVHGKIVSILPKDLSNLINLHHFIVSDDIVQYSYISEVGKLKHLKELSRFDVKRENSGFELKQLGQLLELQVLGIYGLQNVETKEEACEANLNQKDHLQELTLNWDMNLTLNWDMNLQGLALNWDMKRTEQTMQEEDILECLKPHSNLLKLCIRGHGGVKCPTWLGMNLSVQNLEYLCLDHVAWEKLPPLAGSWMLNGCVEDFPNQSFMNLKRLELVHIRNLERWVQSGTSHCYLFLEALVIKGCTELLELPFSHPTCHQPAEQGRNMAWFPRLRELEIADCPKLLYMPPIPWTCAPCSAEIKDAGKGLKLLDYRKGLNWLNGEGYIRQYCLKIHGKDAEDTMLLKVLAFHNLSALTVLKMDKCPPLPLDCLQMLSSLRSLEIQNMSAALLMVEGESYVKYKFPVEHICIKDCGTNGKELTRLLSYFLNLSNLEIWDCQNITGLGVAEPQQMRASSSANKVEAAQIVHHQHQEDARREEEIAAEGLLLLPPQLQMLKIWGCRELSLHPNDKETGWGGGGLQGLRSLRSLEIRFNPKFFSSFSSFPSSCFPFPSSLERLILSNMDGMETPVPLSNLTSLMNLSIFECGELRFQGLWPLLEQGHLTRLSFKKTLNLLVGSDACRSSKLQELCTDDTTRVFTGPICSLLSSSLTSLILESDDGVEIFTKEQEEALQLLTSLQHLKFNWCKKLRHLPAGLYKLANLKTLLIANCNAIQSLPKDGLPSSLQELHVSSCQAIQSLPKECLPSSLQELSIFWCPALRSLPKVEFLQSSLRELQVYNSDSNELRRQCRKLRGTIPIVYA